MNPIKLTPTFHPLNEFLLQPSSCVINKQKQILPGWNSIKFIALEHPFCAPMACFHMLHMSISIPFLSVNDSIYVVLCWSFANWHINFLRSEFINFSSSVFICERKTWNSWFLSRFRSLFVNSLALLIGWTFICLLKLSREENCFLCFHGHSNKFCRCCRCFLLWLSQHSLSPKNPLLWVFKLSLHFH